MINSGLNDKQRKEAEQLDKDIFSDVPRMTHIVEHKVELTPIKSKPYPIPYKMQELVDKEIADMLAMGIMELLAHHMHHRLC